jgi:beta-barrel assembly-enhancing protease
MNRRKFTGGLCGCAAIAASGCVTAPAPGGPTTVAPRYRPSEVDADEAGIWHVIERAEEELKRSAFVVRDPALNAYVRDVTCALARDHCDDIRVYIVRNPLFNASMAPNGMMQVWSGLLLRCHNEAQLAAVIGHEIGHFLRRHTIQRWRDVRSKADFAAFLGMGLSAAGGGAFGSLANLALLASIFGFTRDQEREADLIGLDLMAGAGYSPGETARIWEQLIKEDDAAEVKRERDVFFASHPAPDERATTLKAAAATRAATGAIGDSYRSRYVERLTPLRPWLLADQMRLRQYGRTEALFGMLIEEAERTDRVGIGEFHYFKGEIYRLRDDKDDAGKARRAYEQAIEVGSAPPEVYRSLGLLYRRDGNTPDADAAFRRYLELHPGAPDRDMIRSYLRVAG